MATTAGHLEGKEDHHVTLLSSALRRIHAFTHNAARKRANTACNAMQHYTYDGYRLFRKFYDHNQGEWVERVVIPAGGLKSLWYNGRKRALTLRRRLLLEYHDEERIAVD